MHVFSPSQITCIRPVVEYACDVFHDSLPKYLSTITCRVTLPAHRYNEALDQMGLATLATRRQNLTNTLFKNIVNDSENKLHNLLLPVTPG
jgi:hypothetical protein